MKRAYARLRRIVRLWPGAYFTLPTRPPSLREVDWIIRDIYMPAIREALSAPSLLFARRDR